MIVLKVLAIIFLAVGSFIVFTASFIIERFGLSEKVKCSFESELTEEEILDYKTNKAVLNLKMLGVLIILPGIIMVLLFFK